MNIENQKITIRINNFNEQHFRNIGYLEPKNTYVEIYVKDLPKGSGIKINVTCSYCGKEFKKSYRRYLETKSDICCEQCKQKKMEVTSFKKYGSKCSLRDPLVQEKSKSKNMKNLGVQYPFQNKTILDKCCKTSIKKHGVNYKKTKISIQQKYLHKLYGGILNYPEFPYFLDIFFDRAKIYLEYDGSGHELSVKLGSISQKKFSDNELKRSNFLKNKGYKEFRIISSTDIFSSDEELLKIKDRAFYILLNKNYSKYIYNLDAKTESFEE